MLGLAAQMRRTLAMLDPKNFKSRRWRDGKGLVHLLEAHKMSGMAGGVAWVSACRKHNPSTRRCLDDKTPVTCFACLTKARPEHDEDCALYCPSHGTGKKCRTLHHCELCNGEA